MGCRRMESLLRIIIGIQRTKIRTFFVVLCLLNVAFLWFQPKSVWTTFYKNEMTNNTGTSVGNYYRTLEPLLTKELAKMKSNHSEPNKTSSLQKESPTRLPKPDTDTQKRTPTMLESAHMFTDTGRLTLEEGYRKDINYTVNAANKSEQNTTNDSKETQHAVMTDGLEKRNKTSKAANLSIIMTQLENKVAQRVDATPIRTSPEQVTREGEEAKNLKAAEELMNTLHQLTTALPIGNESSTEELFNNISSILSEPWQHNDNNTALFRYVYNNVTNIMDVYSSVLGKKRKTSKNPPFGSCGVVGSSGILLGSNCGKSIDDEDFVFRFNLASITGFEDDVGNKTNITTMNPSILRRHFHSLKNYSDVVYFSRSKLADQDGIIWTPVGNGIINKTNAAIRLLNDSKLTVVKAKMNHFTRTGRFWSKYGMQKYPSTGFYFVSCAINLCSEVHLYGFWPFDKSPDGSSVTAHYYDEVSISRNTHDFSYEPLMLLTLHRLGLLKFHVGKCT